MQKIIIVILVCLTFSCKTGNNRDILEKKLTQVMVDFYGKSSKKWKILEVLDTENASLADGYKFLIILEVAEINDFFLKNKAKPESLLNDPKEHYKTVFLRNPSLSEKVEYNKSNFFSHSVKLKGLNRETLLFICIDLDKNLVIFDYTEP